MLIFFFRLQIPLDPCRKICAYYIPLKMSYEDGVSSPQEFNQDCSCLVAKILSPGANLF